MSHSSLSVRRGKLIVDRDVEDIWKDHFDYFYREYGKLSFHPLHTNMH